MRQSHFRSGNDNLTFLSKLSLLYAFQMNFRHWFVYREQNNREPNDEVYKFWFRANPLINFGRASVIVSVAPILAMLQIMQLFRI